jgi:hypothetical protein
MDDVKNLMLVIGNETTQIAKSELSDLISEFTTESFKNLLKNFIGSSDTKKKINEKERPEEISSESDNEEEEEENDNDNDTEEIEIIADDDDSVINFKKKFYFHKYFIN